MLGLRPRPCLEGCGSPLPWRRCGSPWRRTFTEPQGSSGVLISPTPDVKKPSHWLGFRSGGEGGIRTPDGLLTHTRFPGVRLKPLIHLSEASREVYQKVGVQGARAARKIANSSDLEGGVQKETNISAKVPAGTPNTAAETGSMPNKRQGLKFSANISGAQQPNM